MAGNSPREDPEPDALKQGKGGSGRDGRWRSRGGVCLTEDGVADGKEPVEIAFPGVDVT